MNSLLYSKALPFLFKKPVFMDAPQPWQMGFQDPATPIMQGIIDLHHDISFFLLSVVGFVVELYGISILQQIQLRQKLFMEQQLKLPGLLLQV